MRQFSIGRLSVQRFSLVVLLGLAGALDKDVAVGDVAVAAEVNEFQANSKAESADEGYALNRPPALNASILAILMLLS